MKPNSCHIYHLSLISYWLINGNYYITTCQILKMVPWWERLDAYGCRLWNNVANTRSNGTLSPYNCNGLQEKNIFSSVPSISFFFHCDMLVVVLSLTPELCGLAAGIAVAGVLMRSPPHIDMVSSAVWHRWQQCSSLFCLRPSATHRASLEWSRQWGGCLGRQLWLTHPVGLSQTTGLPSAYHPIALQWSNLAERASVLTKQKQT